MNRSSRTIDLIAVVLVLAGAGLRLLTLPWLSFSGDETWTLRWITQPVGVLMSRFDVGLSMHLYLLGLKAWVALAGYSERALKLPSLVAGIVALPAIFVLARRWLDESSALAALALAAASLPLIEFSRIARVYIVLVLAAIGLMALFAWAVRRRTRKAWLALGLANAIALMLSGNASYLMVVQGVVLVWEAARDGAARKALLAGFTASCCLALALAVIFYAAALRSALMLLGMWAGGSGSRLDLLAAAANGLHPALPLVFLGLAAAGSIVALRAQTMEGRLLVLWAWLPLFFFAAVGARQPPYALSRFLLPVLPAQLCLAGCAIAAAARRAVSHHSAAVAPALALALAAAGYAAEPGLSRRLAAEPLAMKPALLRLEMIERPGDAVMTYPDWFGWFLTARGTVAPRDWDTFGPTCPDDRYTRLLILTSADASVPAAWTSWFDVQNFAGPHYARGTRILISHPLATADDRRAVLRCLIEAWLEASGNDPAAVPFRVQVDQARLNSALAVLDDQAGAREDAAMHRREADGHMMKAIELSRTSR